MYSKHKIFPTPDNDMKYFIFETLVYKFMKGVKTFLIVPTDAHYYKIIEMLTNLKL